MTDEELIARLRSDHPDHLTAAAADRIEALVEAGRAYREATHHLKPCPETSAAFDAALKGEKP